jgi:hypothetical protein
VLHDIKVWCEANNLEVIQGNSRGRREEKATILQQFPLTDFPTAVSDFKPTDVVAAKPSASSSDVTEPSTSEDDAANDVVDTKQSDSDSDATEDDSESDTSPADESEASSEDADDDTSADEEGDSNTDDKSSDLITSTSTVVVTVTSGSTKRPQTTRRVWME